jgi:copper homeostasis protein
MSKPILLEICVDSVESALAAEHGGAHRVELCSSLPDGGLTPSWGLIATVRKAISIGLQVMVRPRSGDFCYSDDEFEIMRLDILACKDLNADGVVFGILDLDGNVDLPRTRQLVELAAPMKVTFHRAFDMSCDLFQSLRDLQTAGVHCVLTSGGRQTAAEGTATLRRLVDAAGGKIGIMAGGGIEEHNVPALIAHSGVREIHASLKFPVPSPMRYQNTTISLGTSKGREYQRFVVQRHKVQELLQVATNRSADRLH